MHIVGWQKQALQPTAAPQVIDNLPDKPVEREAAAVELKIRVPVGVFPTNAYTVVLSPRAGYRTMNMAGSAINRTIKQTKAAISICAPSV